MCRATTSLATSLALRSAVCKCDKYMAGYSKVVEPSRHNCLPENFPIFVKIKPFIHTRSRQTLQIVSSRISLVHDILEAAANETPAVNNHPEWGSNYRPSPCTDYGMQVLAIETRQRVQPNRPWNIEQRHFKGYTKALANLYSVLAAIIRQRDDFLRTTNPDLMAKAMRYSGAKRAHYIQCALELAAHPLRRRGKDIFHECAGKWGELSEKPRVLLVQSIRSLGVCSAAGNVKPGAVLRAPILLEGWYRDFVEDALHHYCHKRGFHLLRPVAT